MIHFTSVAVGNPLNDKLSLRSEIFCFNSSFWKISCQKNFPYLSMRSLPSGRVNRTIAAFLIRLELFRYRSVALGYCLHVCWGIRLLIISMISFNMCSITTWIDSEQMRVFDLQWELTVCFWMLNSKFIIRYYVV